MTRGLAARVGCRGTWPALVVTAIALSLLAGCSDSDKPKKPSIQTISVLRPPPPPPPPKPEEKPPEPEVKKEEVKLPDPEPEPQQASDEPPPGEQLGVDAEGGAGTDGFGLVGRPGGRDITTIGGGPSGSDRARYSMFANLVQSHLQEELSKRERLRQANYRAVVNVWFSASGSVDRVEVVNGSGNSDIDNAIRTALSGTSVAESPPPDMPQPVKIRLTSRGAG